MRQDLQSELWGNGNPPAETQDTAWLPSLDTTLMRRPLSALSFHLVSIEAHRLVSLEIGGLCPNLA